MRRGPKNRYEPIILTTEENNRLVEWTRRHKTSQGLALRARIVLACQQDRSNREIAQAVARHGADGGQVAWAFSRCPARWSAR